jgi:hypothetical protein
MLKSALRRATLMQATCHARVREKWHIARSRDVAKPPSALSRNLPALSVSRIRSSIAKLVMHLHHRHLRR